MRHIVLSLLLLAITPAAASAQAEQIKAGCQGYWQEDDEVTRDVTLSGNPIIMKHRDGSPWGSDHNAVTMKFGEKIFFLNIETLLAERRVPSFEVGQAVQADYIGSPEAYVKKHDGILLAWMTTWGVHLGAGYLENGEVDCYGGHLIIKFADEIS